MLTAEGCTSRRQRLWKALPSECDLLLVASPESLIYFSNLVISPFVFRSTEAGAVLAMRPDKASLIADSMIRPFLDKAHADEIVAPVWYDGKHSAPERRGKLVHSTVETISAAPIKCVGVELGAVPSGVIEGLRALHPDLQIVDLGPIIRPLRRAKDADEVAVLRRSMRAGEAAQAALLAKVRPGMTELDTYRIALDAAIESAGEGVILYGDFASGPRTATDRGGPPTSRMIEKGDLLLLDFSVIVDGYRGDFTNTFAVGGGPTPRQHELFDACVGALKAGESVLKSGTRGRDVDAASRGHCASLGFGPYYLSHTGHGLGLGHPEPPYFVPESDDSIVEGDVVAIEPGLYVEGVGGMRFERNYLITADGFETLSHHEIRISQ